MKGVVRVRVVGSTSLLLSSLLLLGTCGSENGTNDDGKGGAGAYTIAKVYPPVRAATPNALINDPRFASGGPTAALARAEEEDNDRVIAVRASLRELVNLASVVRERLYSPGPTAILRIVSDLDARTAKIDTDPMQHGCLTNAPVDKTWTFPGGETFAVKLQCLDRFADGSGWTAFGSDDAGDFYLVEGQDGGMGSAYHLSRTTGKVEAWIAVADSRAPSNSQVIMHMLVDGPLFELTFAGSGVGFCAAHLKADADRLFIKGKTNAPPPPGTPMSPDVQYCDVTRTGCFRTADLATDLGGDAPDCADIAASSFKLPVDLDASSDPTGNVTPPHLYMHFATAPADVPAF